MPLYYPDLLARRQIAVIDAADEAYKERLRAQGKLARVDERTDLEALDPRYEFAELPDGRLVRLGFS